MTVVLHACQPPQEQEVISLVLPNGPRKVFPNGFVFGNQPCPGCQCLPNDETIKWVACPTQGSGMVYNGRILLFTNNQTNIRVKRF